MTLVSHSAGLFAAGTSGTSTTQALGVAVPAGDLIVVNAASRSPVTGVTDSQGNTYTPLESAFQGTAPGAACLYATVVTTSLTTSDSITISQTTNISIFCGADSFTGINSNAATTAYAAGSATGSGGPMTAFTSSPVSAGDLAVAVGFSGALPSGWTALEAVSSGQVAGFRIPSTAGIQSFGPVVNYASVIAALTASTGGQSMMM